MQRQPPWSDEWFRRYWVERAPPLTWRGIAASAVVCVVGIAIALAHPHGALFGFVGLSGMIGGVYALRGLFRKAWLALGGREQLLRAFIRKRLGE